MDLLFAIGQAIALCALAYGAALCFIWRDEADPDVARSRRRAKTHPSHSMSSRDYVAAAETDPAS
jgi:hypothetical protein